MKNPNLKKISFSYENLLFRCEKLTNLMKINEVKLLKLGVLKNDIIQFNAKLATFKKLEKDIKTLNTQKQASSTKRIAAKELRILLNDIQIKSEQALNKGTTDILLINFGKISTIDFDNLAIISESYLQVLSERKNELYKHGLTTKDLINLEFGINKFSKARIAQAVARIERGLSTQLRAIAANELYIDYNKYSKLL